MDPGYLEAGVNRVVCISQSLSAASDRVINNFAVYAS
jgi:hypothetical protein